GAPAAVVAVRQREAVDEARATVRRIEDVPRDDGAGPWIVRRGAGRRIARDRPAFASDVLVDEHANAVRMTDPLRTALAARISGDVEERDRQGHVGDEAPWRTADTLDRARGRAAVARDDVAVVALLTGGHDAVAAHGGARDDAGVERVRPAGR